MTLKFEEAKLKFALINEATIIELVENSNRPDNRHTFINSSFSKCTISSQKRDIPNLRN